MSLNLTDGGFCLAQTLLAALAYAAQLGLHELAFAYHPRLIIGSNGFSRTATGISRGLRLGHLEPEIVLLRLVALFYPAAQTPCFGIAFRMENGVNLPVYGCYLSLVGLEITVGLHGVEHRRNEIGMVVAAGKQSGIGGEKTPPAVGSPDDKHAEHLATAGIGAQRAVRHYIPLHLGGGGKTQGMGLVAERIGKPGRVGQAAVKRMKHR